MSMPEAWKNQAPHVVTVACAYVQPDGTCTCAADGADCEWDIRVECPRDEARVCLTWWECMPCQEAIANGDVALEVQLDETSEAHGVEHRHIDCGWSTESDDCWLKESDDIRDAVDDLFPVRDGGMRPGAFLVVMEDADPLRLALVQPAGAVTP